VGFSADTEPAEMLALSRQRDTDLPSYEPTSKLRELIEARSYADQLAGSGDSGIVRMVHVRVYGPEIPYESKPSDQLRRELEELELSFRELDRQARYERDAAKVNLTVCNESVEPLEESALVVHFPVAKGFEVVTSTPVSSAVHVDGKPGNAAVSLVRTLGRIEQGTSVVAFAEPLRVVLTSQCRHRVLPVRYELRAANLPVPMQGKLRFEVA
jgi:hypothetical protein